MHIESLHHSVTRQGVKMSRKCQGILGDLTASAVGGPDLCLGGPQVALCPGLESDPVGAAAGRVADPVQDPEGDQPIYRLLRGPLVDSSGRRKLRAGDVGPPRGAGVNGDGHEDRPSARWERQGCGLDGLQGVSGVLGYHGAKVARDGAPRPEVRRSGPSRGEGGDGLGSGAGSIRRPGLRGAALGLRRSPGGGFRRPKYLKSGGPKAR